MLALIIAYTLCFLAVTFAVVGGHKGGTAHEKAGILLATILCILAVLAARYL